MSIGFGIGDFVLLLQGLVKCASLLRGEAVDGFAGHAEAYESFANGAALLRRFLKAEGKSLKPHLRLELRSLNRLLKEFLSRIQQLEPSLGKTRKKGGLRRILQKLRWPTYDAILSGICHKLSSKFSMIKFIIDLDNGPLNVGPKFVLVDARSDYHSVSMANVKCWEDLATFIQNLFCTGRQSFLAVKHRSYLLRNNMTEETFLLNSPSAPPWEDAISQSTHFPATPAFRPPKNEAIITNTILFN
ncbi:hypothetical protein LZ32DRAFT_614789 [Colletotrichum eremochloae]|nr:hypothetical protein LZ32DRAFT_614789 [Colletotrichum eremochloae]